MPGQLALLLYSGFVVYLLKQDRKKSAHCSAMLWLPTAWVLVTATKSLDYWFGIAGGNSESGGTLDPIFLSLLLCWGVILLGQRKFDWNFAFRANRWLIILIAYMLVSILWSDMMFVSFKRWIREITALIMAFLIVSEANPREALETVLRRTTYILIPYSVLLIKYFQAIGVRYSQWTGDMEWIGVTLQKNALGRLSLTAIVFLIWTLLRRRQKKDLPAGKYHTYAEISVLVMALWLLKGPSMWAASATAIVALTVGMTAFALLSFAKSNNPLIRPGLFCSLVAVVLVVGITTPIVGGSTVAGFTSVVGRNATFTGRTDIWASYLPYARKHELFGWGFGGFYHVPAEAHNGYLDVWLGLGFVGLFLTAMFLLSTTRRSVELLRYGDDHAKLAFSFLLMAAIHNITESSFDSFQRQIMAVVMFLSVCLFTARRTRVRKAVAAVRPPLSTAMQAAHAAR